MVIRYLFWLSEVVLAVLVVVGVQRGLRLLPMHLHPLLPLQVLIRQHTENYDLEVRRYDETARRRQSLCHRDERARMFLQS